MTADVHVSGVTHRFGSFTALDAVDLRIAAGEFAVLLGPSGCGKTTLLSILGGFLRPTDGRILIGGADVTAMPPARRPTTTMFQDYALFPHMSLIDNVGFGPRMQGMARSARNARAAEMLALVGLESEGRRKPHELSGGQRQRVALARALAVEPDVLLLDEPLGALDLKLRRQMQDELKEIQRRVGTTFIHVTHDQEEAMAIADKIVVMNSGRLQAVGPPEEIYLHPANRFTAAFMGEANFVEGRVEEMDGATARLATPLGPLALPVAAVKAPAGSAVSLCFRPEHLTADGEGLLSLGEATVRDASFFGAHRRCHLEAGPPGARQALTAHFPPGLRLEPGATVPLAIDPANVIVIAGEEEGTDAARKA